jgi:hypothetical protein
VWAIFSSQSPLPRRFRRYVVSPHSEGKARSSKKTTPLGKPSFVIDKSDKNDLFRERLVRVAVFQGNSFKDALSDTTKSWRSCVARLLMDDRVNTREPEYCQMLL